MSATSDQIIGAVVECMACSMSGHWPVVEPNSRTHAESLNDEELQVWLTGFRCCGFRQRGISGLRRPAEQPTEAG